MEVTTVAVEQKSVRAFFALHLSSECAVSLFFFSFSSFILRFLFVYIFIIPTAHIEKNGGL